jgi:signal transduction histidine kinase
MKMSLRASLAWSYVGVVGVCMAIIAPLIWIAVENLYISTQSANLLAQAQLLAATLSGESDLPGGAVSQGYSQTSNVQTGIHTRILNSQGAVVIDLAGQIGSASAAGLSLPQLAQNQAGNVTADELLARPEIASAMQGMAATSVRRVDIAGGKPVLYAAAPVQAGKGNVTQIVYLAMPQPDTQWSALPAEIRWQFAGVILLGIGLSCGTGLWLARRIAQPIGQIAQASNQMAAGNLAQNIPEESFISDLESVKHSFNTMTHNLQQANLAKNAFVADVSHELRTPLTVLKGTIETLEDGAIDDEEVRGPFLQSMDEETDRLIRLVNDLLVLTRADAEVLNLNLQPVDMQSIIHDRCLKIEPLAQSADVHVTIDPSDSADDALIVEGDPDRIAQVIDNILSNAIHYSPVDGTVRIDLQVRDGGVMCRVADAGPGIAEKHLGKVFDRFYRVDTSRNRLQGGSGLGLAIVKSLVTAQHGWVKADSSPGQGTTIIFWLPSPI